jgi:STE24 endopeptidase
MFKLVFVLVVIFESLWELILLSLNVRYSTSKNSRIPDVLKDKISEEDFEKSKRYLKDKTFLEYVSILVKLFVTLIFIYVGFPYLERLAINLSNSTIIQGLIFFGIYGLISFLVNLPFKIYSTFVIEEKYGFNTMNSKTFVIDLVKTIFVSVILFTPLISLLLWVLSIDQNWWWKVSLGYILFQIILTLLYPVFIAPLFNKFTPLEDEKLKDEINKLLKKADFNVSNIYVMDASKRTKKQNAYLTGIGKSKRLVLYDTILNYSTEEILAIVGHELGHNKRKHIPKLLLVISVFYTFMFYLINIVYNYLLNNNVFGIKMSYTAFMYSFIFIGSVMFFAMPVINFLQRKFEFEADNYSAKLLGTPDYFISSLKRLVKENLSNVNPLPLYKIWHYSHPSPEERIKNLLKIKKVKN